MSFNIVNATCQYQYCSSKDIGSWRLNIRAFSNINGIMIVLEDEDLNKMFTTHWKWNFYDANSKKRFNQTSWKV
ncbi:hypothetical protein AKO1_005890 [Acrasis kona]|uniref:Uncharacterized protein n=1 Tax=Acrasis kona TaxID=1008807 RepID=A0AAW2YJ48_9EUKA